MDEEEKKRQAASAAFAQAGMIEIGEARRRGVAYQDPDLATQMNRQRGAANGRTEGAEQIASEQDVFGGALPNRRDADDVANNYPEVQAAAWQQTGGRLFGDRSAVPGASEAFAQLDQAQPSNPTQFDAASVAGLEPAQQQMVRENFDANLEAATRAVEEYAQGDDAFSRQAQRLLDRAERARGRQGEQAQPVTPRIQAPVSTQVKPEFVPLVTPADWQTSANMKLTEQYGEDPFAF